MEPQTFELPLELQFSMRKAELEAQEMTWDQLYATLLHLFQQRLMEWHALKSLLANENIDIDFDIPTELELAHLMAYSEDDEDDEDEDEESLQPF